MFRAHAFQEEPDPDGILELRDSEGNATPSYFSRVLLIDGSELERSASLKAFDAGESYTDSKAGSFSSTLHGCDFVAGYYKEYIGSFAFKDLELRKEENCDAVLLIVPRARQTRLSSSQLADTADLLI